MNDRKPEPSGRTMFYMFKVLWDGLYVRLRATVNVVSLSIKWGRSIRVNIKVRIYRTDLEYCPASGDPMMDNRRFRPDHETAPVGYKLETTCPECEQYVVLTPKGRMVRHKPKLMLRTELFNSSIAKE